jgi:hypothetical protein
MSDSRSAIGTADFDSSDDAHERVRIRTDGPCVTETIVGLERGDRGKPMSRAALETIRTQAADVLGSIVESYDLYVAAGEVGADGQHRASANPPRRDRCPTGLLYGRVQSGKTAAMIVTSALAIDNGFRVIVVLTSNNVKLVRQTADRFADLDGPMISSSLDAAGGTYSWERDSGNIRRWMGERGAVFVCAKEDGHLENLIRFLQSIGAADYPALILDDEADHATPDTRVAQRSRARESGKVLPAYSTTFRLVVENDQAPGLSLRETLMHNVFLQVTATPYGLLLQNLNNPLRPAFTRLLHPGQGYTGGEAFFSAAGETATPPLVYVDDLEAQALAGDSSEAPTWLRRSIAFFVFAATAHRVLSGTPPRNGYKYLCHTSAKQQVHRRLSDLILRYVDAFSSQLASEPDEALAREEVVWALKELGRTLPDLPNLDAMVGDIVRYLPRRSMSVVNSEQGADLKFESRYNFLVGGNILGRGLTIDDLLVTYYLRQARVSQMDTMHQHARMYGYRQHLMPFTRVFLSQTLAMRFRQIHESEQALRDLLGESSGGRATPVEVAGDLRPTRSNILDIGSIAAYRPGQHVYPFEPVHDARKLGDSVQRIDRLLAGAFGKIPTPKRYHEIDLDLAKKLIGTIEVQDDGGDWETPALLRVLDATASRYASKAYLHVRDFERTNTTLSTGAVSGDELKLARGMNAPVLFLFRGAKGKTWNADIWYPTVVFPRDMPAIVFSRDA